MALAVGPAITVIYVILGVFGPAPGAGGNNLPSLLRPLKQLSPFKWACEGLCSEEFHGRSFVKPDDELSSSAPTTVKACSQSGQWQSINAGQLLQKVFLGIKRLPETLQIAGMIIKSFVTRQPLSRNKLTDGDRVMINLSLENASLKLSVTELMKLIAAHFLIALAGLILQPKGI